VPPRRSFLPVFHDAPHISGLPDRFVHLPYVTDAAELTQWLETHHVAAFSLLDKTRFAKTNYIQQGKVVYQEIQTSQYWYLDNRHKNHYEVFDSDGRHLGEADIHGNLNTDKAKDGRTLDLS
jgi:hypothetical protein